MWWPRPLEWSPSGGQHRPVPPVRGNGSAQSRPGSLGPPSSSTGALPASAAAGERKMHQDLSQNGAMCISDHCKPLMEVLIVGILYFFDVSFSFIHFLRFIQLYTSFYVSFKSLRLHYSLWDDWHPPITQTEERGQPAFLHYMLILVQKTG